MAPVRAKATREKYCTFFYSLHPDVKRLARRLEVINDKLDRNEMSVRLNLTPPRIYIGMHIYIQAYIYTYISVCVCVCVCTYLILLWYHPYFRYTMNFSNKDITFDGDPLIAVAVLLNCTNPVDGGHFGGRGINCMDLDGCVTSLDTVVGRGLLTRGVREALHSRHTAKTDIPLA